MKNLLVIAPENLKTFITDGVFKFVKLSSGEYRFGPNDVKHSNLLQPDEVAISAGVGFLFDTYWYIDSRWSMSLNIGCKGGEEEEISKLIGIPYKE